jgi:hypothetical protein
MTGSSVKRLVGVGSRDRDGHYLDCLHGSAWHAWSKRTSASSLRSVSLHGRVLLDALGVGAQRREQPLSHQGRRELEKLLAQTVPGPFYGLGADR